MNKNKRKNIIIISTIKLYKGNSAGSARMMNFARAIALKNPVYLLSFTYPLKLNQTQLNEVEANIFINTFNNKAKSLLVKILYPFHLFFFLRKVFILTTKLKGKSVFYLYPTTRPLMDLLVVLYLIGLKKQKVYYEVSEVRRYSHAFIIQKTFFQNPCQYIIKKVRLSIFIIIEKLTKYYTGLVCISTNIQQYFLQYNKNTIRIPILSNGIVNDNIDPQHDQENSFRICFAGMINIKKENLELFFKSLSRLKSNFKSFEVHLYGPVTIQEKNIIFNKLLPALNLNDKVLYKGIVNQKELFTIFQKYHLLVLPRGYTLQNHYGFSTKLSEYLTSGIPVLVTNVSDNGIYIKDNINGFIIEPDDDKIMTEKLLYIIKEYNKIATEIKRNAITTVNEYFDYRNYSNVINNFLC